MLLPSLFDHKSCGEKRILRVFFLTFLATMMMLMTRSKHQKVQAFTYVSKNYRSATRRYLNVLVFTGSTRCEGPPHPANVGKRVGMFVCTELENRGHQVEIIDPIESEISLMKKPHFAYSKTTVPKNLDDIAQKIAKADAFVMVTPEYNHSFSPALSNLLNHFGSSLFSFKPSGIVAYSQGQWGGTRAAIALRPFLSELGCLPVSAMVQIPTAHQVLDDSGTVSTEQQYERWSTYFGRMEAQLNWWGCAAKEHKAKADPFKASPANTKSPTQRNAPPPSSSSSSS